MKKGHFLLLPIVCLLLLVSCHRIIPELDGKFSIDFDWEFQYQGKWYPAFVPSYIHTDLMFNSLIPDPFFGTNEDSVQWVGDSSWTYRFVFDDINFDPKYHPEIVFEGVTGYAEFYLNDEPFLNQEGNNYCDNAFRTWRFAIPSNIKEKNNVLTVKFIPAKNIIHQRKSQVPYVLPDERAFLRTPPYQAGWDWGPKLVTCGLTKPVYFVRWQKFTLSNFNVRQNSLNEDEAHLLVSFDIEADEDENVNISYLINGKVVKYVRGAVVNKGVESFSTGLTIRKPLLWFPNGMGEQNMYDVSVIVKKGSKEEHLDTRIGLRTIELNTKRDSIGFPFEFLVNGEPLFIKGVNWIPADFFTTRMNGDRYRQLLQSCKESNMNMVRVWGGGVYENDEFYDLCDEMGLLVWQDFMYSCALYPGDSAFMHNAEVEAVEQVTRLRNHPSIALWCGNNEVKNGWEDWGWQSSYRPQHRKELDRNMHFLFDTLLQKIVKNYQGNCPYVSSSPLWGWGHPECCTEGDSHYWGVWWGEFPFEMYEEKTGRFMSEYGFQSYPTWYSLLKFVPESERTLASATMLNHQKHGRGVQIINAALSQYFHQTQKLSDFAYLSQLAQAYAMQLAIDAHRRQMPHCMGTLYWQLNDCWPVASWSSIDYYGNWKAVQYVAKHEYEPVIIVTAPMQKKELPICLVNDKNENCNVHLNIYLCRFDGSVVDSVQVNDITMHANSSEQIYRYVLPQKIRKRALDTHYLKICLYDDNNQLVAQRIHYYLYPNQMTFSSEGIRIAVRRENAGTPQETYKFTLSADEIKYGVMISTNLTGHYSDNNLTLLPGDTVEISFVPNERPAKKQLHYRVDAYDSPSRH